MVGIPIEKLVEWANKYVLHTPYSMVNTNNGSGDTGYNYIEEFVIEVLAFIICIVWSLFDHKRSEYTKLHYWLRVLVRYSLAFALVGYGYAKIFKTQFPTPTLSRLAETYGDSSPMGLAWTFFGFSKPFNFFMGFFEAIGGILLFFRRTTLLGACISCTVLVNIVLINFCYDVPVKLYSSYLLLKVLFILAGDGRRFFNFFVLNQPVPPADLTPIFKEKGWKITRWVVKGLVIAGVGWLGYEQIDFNHKVDDAIPKPHLYGTYTVEIFNRNNVTRVPATTDSLRWQKLGIYNNGRTVITKMNDMVVNCSFSDDTVQRVLFIHPNNSQRRDNKLTYVVVDSNTLDLQGNYENDYLYMRLKRKKDNTSMLMNRGFHWVNERPYNL